jgi:hypothetical protein
VMFSLVSGDTPTLKFPGYVQGMDGSSGAAN